MRVSHTFHKIILTLLGVLLFCTDASWLAAQQTADGPIEATFRVRRVFARDYDDTFGGITQAENTWTVSAQDLANLDGLGLRGNQCITFDPQANQFPFTSGVINRTIFTQLYNTNVPTLYQTRMDAWEDDCGNRCGFDSGGFSCLFDGDDSRCIASTTVNFRNNLPGRFTNNGFFFYCGGDYGLELESRWRFTQGDNINNPIALGTTDCASQTFTHLNNTETYSQSSGSPRSSRDVYYSFTLLRDAQVSVTTCGPNTSFDSYLYLQNSAGTTLTQNNNFSGCGFSPLLSTINNITLPSGTYFIVVEGATITSQGVFNLEVNVSPLGANTSIVGLPATLCSNGANVTMTGVPAGGTFAGPGVSGNTFSPSSLTPGTYTVAYNVPTSNSYSVAATNFSNTNIAGGTSVSLANNQNTADLPIGFSFGFYGNTYSTFRISSNGFISFGSQANSGAGSQQIPNTADPDNLIALFWEDLNPAAGNGTGPTAGRNRIGYRTIGSAPNRQLIVSFNRVDHNPSGNLVSGQIKLFEGSNNIEVHVDDMNSDGGQHTLGIENSNGTQATAPSGRNRFSTSLNNEAWRFTPPSICAGTADQQVIIVAPPNAGFTGLPTSICVNATPISLTPNLAGGTFTGPGISGSTFNPATAGTGTFTITYSITDGNGCSNSASATVSVLGITAVSFSGLASTYCPGDGPVTLVGSPSGGTFSGPGISGNTFNPVTANTGTHTITYSFTNGSGCTSTSSQTTTVQDVIPPTAVCQDITLQLNGAGNASLTAAQVDGGSTDNCGVAGLSLSTTAFTCADALTLPNLLATGRFSGRTVTYNNVTINGQNTRTTNVAPGAAVSLTLNWTNTYTSTFCPGCIQQYYLGLSGDGVNETCLFSGGSSFTFTRNNTISFTAPSTPGVYAVSMGSSLQFGCVTRNFGARDLCGSANGLVAIIIVGNPTTTTLTVTDGAGLSSSCTANVVVQDITPPTAICQDITVALNGTGQASINASNIDGGSFDACGLSSITASTRSFDCSQVGQNTVTLELEDNHCNTSSCNAIVTVQDTIPPVALCQDLTVHLSGTGTATVTASAVDNGSSDNCGLSGVSLTPSVFSCANTGNNTAILTATDVNGNVSTCTATITVLDTIAPVITCPPAITLNCPRQPILGFTGTATATDNCGIPVVTFADLVFPGQNPLAGAIHRWPADGNANDVIGTSNGTLNNGASLGAGNFGGAFSVNGANQSVTFGNTAGNFGTGDFTIGFWINTTFSGAPMAILNKRVACTSLPAFWDFRMGPTGQIGWEFRNSVIVGNVATTTAINDGNWHQITVTRMGTTTRMYLDGVQEGINTVTGLLNADNTAQLTMGTDICLGVDGTVPMQGSMDELVLYNRAITPAEINTLNQNCLANSAILRTWTATDASGNSVSCNQIITLQDTTPPVAACQDVTIQLDGSGNAAITANAVNNNSVDACGTVSLSLDDSTFTCTQSGANTVTLTVADACGNASTCTANITVLDSLSPTVVCQDITVNMTAGLTVTAAANDLLSSSSDNCGITTSTLAPNSFDCDDVDSTYLATVIATDAAGNSSQCSANITIADPGLFCNQPPVAVCQDITVFTDANCQGNAVATDVDGGSSDPDMDPLTFSINPAGPFALGNTTVTLTVTDPLGETDSCTATITVVDSTSPTALCQDVTVQLDAAGNGSITTPDIDNGSNDACGIAGLSVSPTAFTCANVGANTVVLLVTDINGNTNTCSATVTVEDSVSPVALCQDVTVLLDAAGNGSITAQDIDNGSNDACGIAGLSVSPAAFTCTNVGANAVVLLVTDANGNTSTCSATVTVEDNVNPVAVCQDITVQLDVSGNTSITPQDIDNGSGDACGNANLSVNVSSFTCSDVGANTVTLTVTDNNGNSSTCASTVTVQDNIGPNAICQDLSLQLDSLGQAFITPPDVNNGSTDACGISLLSLNDSTFICADTGTSSVILTVTDQNNNSSTCTANITLADTIAPIALCMDATVALNNLGEATLLPLDVDAGTSDNCGLQSLIVIPGVYSCSNVGVVSATLRAVDISGNLSTCIAQITVNDQIAPIARCQDVTVQLDAAGNGATTPFLVDDGSNDACGIAQYVLSTTDFTCADVGANPVTLTVTDNNGNTASCSASVAVEDNVDPVAVCRDLTVQLDANGSASITAQDIDNGSNDACGIDSLNIDLSTFGCGDVASGGGSSGPTPTDLFISEYIEASGGADKAIEFFNGTGAAIDLSANSYSLGLYLNGAATPNITINLNGIVPNNDVFVLAENSANATILSAADQVANFNWTGDDAVVLMKGGQIVDILGVTGNDPGTQWQASTNTNLRTRNQTLIRLPNVAAGITTNPTGTGPTGFATLATEWNFLGNNNYSDLGQHTFAGSTGGGGGGGNTVTLTVIDVNGNSSSCTGDITIEDTVAPTAVCQDITLQLNATGNGSLTPQDIDNGSNDACGVDSLSVDVSAFACADVGANTVTLSVFDANGNSSTCAATVTVEDNVAPVATCQDVTVQLDAAGNGSITAQDIDNGSNDACGIANLSVDVSAFACADVGANVVTLTVIDNNGNVSTCTATVTVTDSIAPIAICQDVTVQLDAAGNGSITAQDIDNGSNDACGIASLSVDVSAFACADVGANVVTLTVTDNNGNVSTCTATATVEDSIAPIAICQDVTVQLDAAGNGSITAQDIDNGSNDACGIASLNVDVSAFACADVGANVVTLTVTDNNGNVSTCAATVTVTDSIAPIAICQDVTVQLDAAGNGSITAQDIDNGSNDACGIASLSVDVSAFACADVGANVVTLTVTDNNGNVSTCGATVTVEDSIAPIAICQDVTVQLDAAGNGSIAAQDIDNGSNDACGITSLSVDVSAFTCADVGANVVTLTVTDNNGNVSTCGATVTVEDSIAPVAICQDVTVQLDAAGNGSITAQDIDNGSNDACGIASLSVDVSAFACADVGANVVTLTVTDNNGNVSTCTATATVEDNIAPVAICQDVTVQLDALGNGTVTGQDVDNGSNDACGIASLSVSIGAFTCSDVGPNAVTLTVTDNNGNVSTCAATATVEDTIPPTAICQDITLNLASSGSVGITVQEVDGGSNDACGIASTSIDVDTFDCSNQGANAVVLTVTDVNGNVSTCTATVTITVDPLVATLSSPTYNCGFNIGCFGNADGEATVAVTGGCLPYTFLWNDPMTQTTATASNLAAGSYTVTVTDGNGNTTLETITLTQPDSLIVDLGPDVVLNYGCSCADLTPASISGGCAPYTFLWGTQETTPVITVCPGKTLFIPLTITDANGCVAKDSMYIVIPIAESQTDQYVVLGASQVQIGNGVIALAGGIGVTDVASGQLSVGIGANLNPAGNNWLTGQNITVGNSSSVGNLFTGTTPSLGSGVSSGTVSPMPTPLPVIPCTPPLPGGAAITVAPNQTVSLAPGNYGAVTIATRGVLSLAPGVYTFSSITTSNNANMTAVTGIGSDVGIFVSGNVSFGNGSAITASIAAPSSTITVGDGSNVLGHLVADQVFIGNNVRLKLEAFCWGSLDCGINKEAQAPAEIESGLGGDLELLVYPNPFREEVNLEFELGSLSEGEIVVVDMNGRVVRNLYKGELDAGIRHLVWDGQNDVGVAQANGIYYLKVRVADHLEVIKVVLSR